MNKSAQTLLVATAASLLVACGGGGPDIPAPQELRFTQLAASTFSGVRVASNVAALTDEAYAALWRDYGSSISEPPARPPVDMSMNSVAAIFLGNVTNCTRPEVQSVAVTPAATIRVSYRIVGPGPTALCAAALMSPAQVISFPNGTKLPVEFAQVAQ